MPVLLVVLFMACHGLVVAFWPGTAGAGSFVFLTAAPLLAAGVCLWRAHRDPVAPGWRALALALCLWAGGMAFNMIDAMGAGRADLTPRISLLLYVSYAVPLVFILARARRERLRISLIDAAMAALLGALFFAHTRFFADRIDVDAHAMASMRYMFDIQNLCVAGFAVVRWWAGDVPERESFFRALALYALAYLLVAGFINHVISEEAFGAYGDLLIDVPFLLLAVLAWRPSPPPPRTIHPRLSRLVQAGGPMILPLLLLVVGTLVVDHARLLAVVGFAVATLGFGLRSTVLQIDLLERQAALDQLARQDGLTGVANRRQFDVVLRAEWNRARRNGTALALLLIDIDHFKAFNDAHGHPAGDRCLQAVAAQLQRTVQRSADCVARYGGEEFAVVVPGSPLEGVRALAERLRLAVEVIGLPEAPVSISVGVAFVHPPAMADPQQLLAQADAALYAAKHAGRNRVVVQEGMCGPIAC